MTYLSVSIIIPAYNCEKTILQTLQCSFDQAYKDIKDVIVVDDGSTDRTAQIVQSVKGVTYVYQNNAGPAAARNRGVKEATGDVVFFTDSDCLPQRGWIDNSIKHFDNPGIAAVAGSYGIANQNNRLARCVHKEILFRHRVLMPQYPKVFGSYNVGIRKDVFKEVEGFDVSYRYASGEDNDLSYKILKAGYKIYFESQSFVDHFHPTKIKKYLREQYVHGFWRMKMYLKYPNMIRGDDYTFWKDIVEIPLSFFIVLGAALSIISFLFVKIFTASAVLFLFFIQAYYVCVMFNSFFDSFFFSFVMFFRAFARMFGFSSGVLYFLFNKKTKKSK